MLRVTVELVPFGNADKAKIIGTAIIGNTLSGTPERGNYYVTLARSDEHIWKDGEVTNFPRQYRSCWDLLYLALKNIVGKRNEGD